MFNGTLPNTAGIRRLTIGVTGKDGKRVDLAFVAPEFSRDNTTAPLHAVVADDPQPLPPTEEEMNEHYLTLNGWERVGQDQQDGLSDFWKNHITGDIVPFAVAMNVQEGRDLYDTTFYANAETPLGDEIYGGE